MFENTEGGNKKGQSRETGNIGLENTEGAIKKNNPETGNIGYTRHRTHTCLRIPKGQ